MEDSTIKTKVIKFGLKLKNSENILQYNTCSLGYNVQYSVDTEYTLTESGDADWLIDDFNQALYVMFNNTQSYNADYYTPVNGYNPDDLEIVEVEIITTAKLINVNFVKIILKDEFAIDGRIQYYNSDKYKDTMFMEGKIGFAIDKGDYYQITKMDGIFSNIYNECNFDKNYFKIID